ncbi:MAG: ABC transporter permease [Candidatus Thermoplasmatota archaeon]|nr:ABC transporter permease [Candidatus Thermoplasmatota archaeon]
MSQLKTLLKWDVILQARYKIIHLSLISVIVYWLAVVAIESMNTTQYKTMFLFFDSTLIGIMFVGALVLFEKTENTLQALTVTPMQTRTYFLSKIISLTVLSVLSAHLFILLVHGIDFQYFYLIIGIVLTSILLILIGFILVARCNSLNEYLLLMMLAFVLLFLPPLLDISGIYTNVLFYLWPSEASFLLFQGIFDSLSLTDTLYAIVYLSAWIVACYYLAKKAFYKHIVVGG